MSGGEITPLRVGDPPREHELKTWPEFFDEVAAGRKTFEIRENDRGFAVGDVLRLCEFRPQWGTYTGRQVLKRVSYLTEFQQRPGFVVLGLQDTSQPSSPLRGEMTRQTVSTRPMKARRESTCYRPSPLRGEIRKGQEILSRVDRPKHARRQPASSIVRRRTSRSDAA